MLLLHQTGTVKVGDVVRYTVTYTPAHDRILPAPACLHLKIKNTSAIALRAAFVHGPYTLYVSSAPAAFRADARFANPRRDGVPEFEPNLKAGATWTTRLAVPQEARRGAGTGAAAAAAAADEEEHPESVSWVVEVMSQVIFSTSAAVHYEVLLGRDEKSLSLGFGMGAAKANPAAVPGRVSDHQMGRDGHHAAQPKGVFSRAIRLRVEDTASLWNNPKLPEWEDEGRGRPVAKDVGVSAGGEAKEAEKTEDGDVRARKKQKKVHLVVLTHGLHSNLGADMLYLKESIDAAAKQAKEDAKRRRVERREEEEKKAETAKRSVEEIHEAERRNDSGDVRAPAELKEANADESEDEEEVIVRGFSGNAVRTEKGIKYLGKRLAKYVLAMTYPDQPFRSVTRSTGQNIKAAVKNDSSKENEKLGEQAHAHSSVREEPYTDNKLLAYKITSISFIAHSLGGLTQTYAVAYIQKHSPDFFDRIKGINFICLATPFLGLSNENPLYVKFALDFGLVGRTGQDLGLTWRAPNIARSGWDALVNGRGEVGLERPRDPGSKPLLRILPTGPAHVALKKFRNRTVYSNVVNDGIVPLRTSCLLFLDWQGLGRVEKARRENGLVGTMAGWGWAELTGQNATAAVREKWIEEAKSHDVDESEDAEANTPTRQGRGDVVPQPPPDATEDDVRSLKDIKMSETLSIRKESENGVSGQPAPVTTTASTKGPLDTILEFFSPKPGTKTVPEDPKNAKIYRRSQTVNFDHPIKKSSSESSSESSLPSKVGGAASDEPLESSAPPKTTFFEAAGDILAPPFPPLSFLLDPSARPRTIFHDRVYHPSDIPPPPMKRASAGTLLRRRTSTGGPSGAPPPSSRASTSSSASVSTLAPPEIDTAAMKVEEKIARAYHRDLSWRKVLVRLEPDAHNNIIVRRRFANAYGWPVVKHLVDTHFSDRAVATTRDDDEGGQERAMDAAQAPGPHGEEIVPAERTLSGGSHRDPEPEEPAPHRFLNPAQRGGAEEGDCVPELGKGGSRKGSRSGSESRSRRRRTRPVLQRMDSETWSDGDFLDSDGDSDVEVSGGKQQEALRPRRENQPPAPAPSAGWNWTEAIVGKGAAGPRSERLAQQQQQQQRQQQRTPSQTALPHRRMESREFHVRSPTESADEGTVEDVDDGGEEEEEEEEVTPTGEGPQLGDAMAVGVGASMEEGGEGVGERVARMVGGVREGEVEGGRREGLDSA